MVKQTKEKTPIFESVGVVSVAMLVIAFMLSGLMLFTSTEDLEKNTLSVRGNAETEVEPDKFSLRLGVESVGSNVEEQESQVRTNMNNVVDSLKELGLEEDELQTSSFTIREDFRSSNRDELPQSREYRVSQEIQIESDKLDLLPQILDTSIEQGLNSVSSLQFKLSEQRREEERKSLLEEAMNKAYDEAQIVAQAGDTSIKGISQINVGSFSTSPYRASMEFAAEDSASQMPSIEPGRVSVNAGVQVEYELR